MALFFRTGTNPFFASENPYLKELVRYIHLNPLRAGLVPDYESLNAFAYGGHCVLMGKCFLEWQNAGYILSLFSQNEPEARSLYEKFVEEGVHLGKRPEMTGGGLIRSLGGWTAAKAALRGIKERVKGDTYSGGRRFCTRGFRCKPGTIRTMLLVSSQGI